MQCILALAFALALIAAAPASAASMASLHHGAATAVPRCVKGKLCGHTCIAKNKVCYQGPHGLTIPPHVNPAVAKANPPH
jgi:hypothetical protein